MLPSRTRARIASVFAVAFFFGVAAFRARPAARRSSLQLGAQPVIGRRTVGRPLRRAGDIGIIWLLTATTGLAASLFGLLLWFLKLEEFPLNDPDIQEPIWFWAAALCTLIGLLLPIRLYVGALGWPRDSEPRRPSLAGILGMVAYFGLVALPVLTVAAENGGAALAMACFLAAICGGPALALLSSAMRLRVLAAVAAAGGFALWGFAASHESAVLATSVTMFTPLTATLLARWAGLRLRR